LSSIRTAAARFSVRMVSATGWGGGSKATQTCGFRAIRAASQGCSCCASMKYSNEPSERTLEGKRAWNAAPHPVAHVNAS